MHLPNRTNVWYPLRYLIDGYPEGLSRDSIPKRAEGESSVSPKANSERDLQLENKAKCRMRVHSRLYKAICIDPSIRNTAFVCVQFLGDTIQIEDYSISQTDKSKDKKTPVMKDRLDRCNIHLEAFKKQFDEFQPDCVYFEYPTGSQSSSAAIGIGYCLTLMSAIEVFCNIPVYGCTAKNLKDIIGTKNPDKKEIIAYVDKKYPNILPIKNNGEINLGKAEHIADAILVAEHFLNN